MFNTKKNQLMFLPTLLATGGGDAGGKHPGWLVPVAVFCQVYSFLLMTTDDEEFYTRQIPLPLDQLPNLVNLLKVLTRCVGNSQFAPIRKPSEFARSHPTSHRAVQTCELGALQRSAALALYVGSRNSHQFAIICNSRIRTHIRNIAYYLGRLQGCQQVLLPF